jgi:cytochrome c oxidase subunit 2
MRQKLDAVPGLNGQLWFKPLHPGRYEIACAELCGSQHYAMRGELLVMPQEEFDQWYDMEYEFVKEALEEEAAAEEEEAMDEDEAEEEEAEDQAGDP